MNVTKCKVCGALVDAEAIFCDQCGVALPKNEVESPPKKSYSNPPPEEDFVSLQDKDDNIGIDDSFRKQEPPSYHNMSAQNAIKRHLPKIILCTVCFFIIVFVFLLTSSYSKNNLSDSNTTDIDFKVDEEIPDCSYSDYTVSINGFDAYPVLFAYELKERDRIKVGYRVYPEEGDCTGTYICWIRSKSGWKQIGAFKVYEYEKEYINTFYMDPPLSFDALVITPEYYDGDETITYTSDYTFYESE